MWQAPMVFLVGMGRRDNVYGSFSRGLWCESVCAVYSKQQFRQIKKVLTENFFSKHQEHKKRI